MKKNVISLAMLSILGSPIAVADEPIDLGNLDITEGNRDQESVADSAVAYDSYDPIDSGASVINEHMIQNSKRGGMDTTELLKSTPFVQVDNSLDDATQENLQSIRPKDFSISGGNYYDNNIQIDGISATSVHDVTEPSGDLDYNNVYGQTSQTLYVSPDLLGAVEIYDSNVSARYGDFVGGVVNYKIRQPKKNFGFSLSSSYQNDSMVKYHEPTNPDNDTDSPAKFSKQQSTISFDLPLTQKLNVLTQYSFNESNVRYQEDEKYGGQTHDNADTSKNFLLKAIYESREDLSFEAQLIHSPYESERDRPNARHDLMISHSSGTQGYISVNGYTGVTDWESKFSIMYNDASRESANERYVLDGDYLDWCDSHKNCIDGGIGNLDQTQTDYTWQTSLSTFLEHGTLNYGSEFKYTKAAKVRPSDVDYYFSSKASATDDYMCAAGDDSCTPDIADSRYYNYTTFNAHVDVYSHALWAEYLTQWGPVELRTGARYSYDDFLGNHNIAPRFVASWEFLDETYLTLGANRYYSNKMIGYAIKEQIPAQSCYQRDLKNGSDGGYGGAPGDWYECSHQPSTNQYSNADLNTPYSDELTAAITIPTPLQGHFRLKTVYRNNRDQFAKSEELTNEHGDDYYQMTNNGKTDYYGYSMEWTGHYKKHAFNANITWSETKNNGLVDYFSNAEDETEYVYYAGQIMTRADMYEHDARQNYAAPVRASVSWSTLWFNDSLMTNTTLYYRGQYEYLDDTGDNYKDENGKKYDMYDVETVKSLTTVDLNATYYFLKSEQHKASIDLRIKNVFDEVTGSTSNYQIGRSFWIGLHYSM